MRNLRLKKSLHIIWILIILSPLIVGIIVSIHIVDIPISNDWIGFYAAIIGGLLSGLFTFYGVYKSLNGIRREM